MVQHNISKHFERSLEGATKLKLAPFSSPWYVSNGILYSKHFSDSQKSIVHGFWPENKNIDLGKK